MNKIKNTCHLRALYCHPRESGDPSCNNPMVAKWNPAFAGMTVLLYLVSTVIFSSLAHAEMTDYPKVRLRSLDKVTARTMTFEARVGTTIKFGSIFIKTQSCRKPDLQERPEAAAFLQIWEVTPKEESKWIFSGWMFASSPALSAMDHPIYDVWVLDCIGDETPGKEGEETSGPAAETPAPEDEAATPPPSLEDVLKKAAGTPDTGSTADQPAAGPKDTEAPKD